MDSQTSNLKLKNYYDNFPKDREFFLLDKEDNIKDFKQTDMNDPEHLFVFTENKEKKNQQKIYKKSNFLKDYDFVRVETVNTNIYLNFIIPKFKFEKGDRGIRLLTEIKNKTSFMKDIYIKTKINFQSNNIVFKEIISAPNDKKFYNKIFILPKNQQILNESRKRQNQNIIYNNYNGYNNPNNNSINLNNNTHFYNGGFYYNNNNLEHFTLVQRPNMNQFNNIDNIQYINDQNNYNIIQNNQNQAYSQNNSVQNNLYNINNSNQNYINISNNQFNNSNTNNNSNINNQQNINNGISNNYQNLTNSDKDNSNKKDLNFPPDNKQKNNLSDKDKSEKNLKPKPEKNDEDKSDDKFGTKPPENPPKKYIFPTKGLRNIGSTCYMNATLQCLLHVNELIVYFIDEYPKDQKTLNEINKNAPTRGDISRVFFNLVNGVYDEENPKKSKKSIKAKTSFWPFGSGNKDTFSPDEFKKTLGKHNIQFRKFEANDSKDLILYLLQTLHEELNYFGNKNQRLKYIPNQYNIFETFSHFNYNYNSNNFSKISVLFYGTYLNSTACQTCKNILYNFQKFEFISFGLFKYNNKTFNIMDGFRDNSMPSLLAGDNQFFCGYCKQLKDAETTCTIFEPPNKLLINLDYGKNKKYKPSRIDFDEEIDITNFVNFDYKQKFKYRLLSVCTHYGNSGSSGHYIAFCRNKDNRWYEFNDSSCSECSKNSIYGGSPYLLLYERIFG